MSDPWEEHDKIARRPINVVIPDGTLRFRIKSRTQAGIEHIVELDSYKGHGMCSCKGFQHFYSGPLQKGISPRVAFEDGWFKELKPWQLTPDDACCCFHLVEARRELALIFVQAVIKAQLQKNHEIQNIHETQPNQEEANPY